FKHGQKRRQPDREGGEDDVKADGEGELQPRQQKGVDIHVARSRPYPIVLRRSRAFPLLKREPAPSTATPWATSQWRCGPDRRKRTAQAACNGPVAGLASLAD